MLYSRSQDGWITVGRRWSRQRVVYYTAWRLPVQLMAKLAAPFSQSQRTMMVSLSCSLDIRNVCTSRQTRSLLMVWNPCALLSPEEDGSSDGTYQCDVTQFFQNTMIQTFIVMLIFAKCYPKEPSASRFNHVNGVNWSLKGISIPLIIRLWCAENHPRIPSSGTTLEL